MSRGVKTDALTLHFGDKHMRKPHNALHIMLTCSTLNPKDVMFRVVMVELIKRRATLDCCIK